MCETRTEAAIDTLYDLSAAVPIRVWMKSARSVQLNVDGCIDEVRRIVITYTEDTGHWVPSTVLRTSTKVPTTLTTVRVGTHLPTCTYLCTNWRYYCIASYTEFLARICGKLGIVACVAPRLKFSG